MLPNTLPKNRELCHSIIEADSLPEMNIAWETTAISDRDSICKNQGFDIGWTYQITGAEKVLTNPYSKREFYLIIISSIFLMKNYVRSTFQKSYIL